MIYGKMRKNRDHRMKRKKNLKAITVVAVNLNQIVIAAIIANRRILPRRKIVLRDRIHRNNNNKIIAMEMEMSRRAI